jgi:lysozyme family protein
MNAAASVFDTAFAWLVGEEGGFTDDPRDPGNWTGGAVGRGDCNGTNWGIAACAFPACDIRALTRDEAAALYHQHYWAPICGDQLPPALAILVFDAAVNNGVARAGTWLQQALGLAPDGQIGPATLAAIAGSASEALCTEFLARRTDYMARLPDWRVFGLGWARRLAAVGFAAARQAGPA